ncbi:MAG: hypothetical protein GX778_00300 [Erysipelothrix sp.]|nr:hypothetical protein [Erysipelothrix sp.]
MKNNNATSNEKRILKLFTWILTIVTSLGIDYLFESQFVGLGNWKYALNILIIIALLFFYEWLLDIVYIKLKENRA